MFDLSLVVPCFNEEENVDDFYAAAKSVFDNSDYNYEIVFVNDGSHDKTFSKLRMIHEKDKRVSVISFSRNFGKEAAMLAGLKRSKGNMVCIIDADLQQHPSVAKEMADFLKANDEYDCVVAYQQERKESKSIQRMKKLFYKIINRVSDTEFVTGASDFRIFRRAMVEAIVAMPEYHRFSKGIFSWVGYNTYFMPYSALERNAGETKWSFRKLLKYAMEGFISFTTFPLKIATFLGILSSLLSVIYFGVVVIQKLFFGIDVPGYPTVIGLILLIGGLQLLILGIIGEYLARIYIQSKNRPIYIEKEVILSDDKEDKDQNNN